jgi:adenosylhomocysteine nucleosidase
MKILVTFALENEFAPWRALRAFHRETWGTATAFFTEIGGAEVGVVLTGAGPKQAGVEASKVIWGEYDSISACISSGLAGSLKPEYRIAQVLAARAIRSETARADAPNDVLASSAALISFAGECGASVVDEFYSADRVIGRSEEKRHLGASADAVEMESFEILLEAAAFAIPAIAIRSISDTVDEDLPLDMNRIFSDEGQVSLPRVIGEVVRHPGSVPRLMRLGQNSKAAAESLARFLDEYVAVIAERYKGLEAQARATGGAG